MEIQEYEKPPTLLSPGRSVSSSSLKDQLSPVEPASAGITIYRKIPNQSLSGHQMDPYFYHQQTMQQRLTHSVSARY